MSERQYGRITQPGGWVSVDPLPSTEELQAFYADVYFQAPPTSSYDTAYGAQELAHRSLKARVMLRALAQRGVTNGASLLDVGAGEGFLMHEALGAGLAVRGLDFSTAGVQRCFPALVDRLTAGDVLTSLAALDAAGDRFHAVTCLNVVEHVREPLALAARMRSVLAPGGVIAITVPNDFSVLQAHLRETAAVAVDYWFAPPQHLHYFNTRTLPAFCAEAGLRVIDAFADFPIDLFLLHPGANYIREPANGRAAHHARMTVDLLMAESGFDAYLDVYRALFRTGLGRDLTVICDVEPGA